MRTTPNLKQRTTGRPTFVIATVSVSLEWKHVLTKR
jgi:hypothetical protein